MGSLRTPNLAKKLFKILHPLLHYIDHIREWYITINNTCNVNSILNLNSTQFSINQLHWNQCSKRRRKNNKKTRSKYKETQSKHTPGMAILCRLRFAAASSEFRTALLRHANNNMITATKIMREKNYTNSHRKIALDLT